MPETFVGEIRTPIAQKDYRCEWCGQPIPKGEKHKRHSGRWDGDFYSYRLHTECAEALAKDPDSEDGWMPFENERPPKEGQ